MTTEQETGRGTPVRRAVPKTGTRRSGASYQSKPRPRPDARPDVNGKRPVGERERSGQRTVGAEADAKRTGAERARPEADGKRVRPEADGKRAGAERVRPEADGRRAGTTRARPETDGKRMGTTRVRSAEGRASGATRVRPETERKATAPAKPRSRPEAGPSGRARRRSGPPSRSTRRQRAPFVLLVVGLMSGGLVSLLLLNTMLAQDAITDASLREQIEVARQENDRINLEYQRKTQPEAIATAAANQGMGDDWDNVNHLSSGNGQVDTGR
ncbi:hypothetical protein ACFOY2_10135 [Nonomuraea purpurea]|uniref:Cell division protein FtsL n=1 Tax=Nonomuraea purpurea TaxID=1849276 RepID=A0ABV8G4P3_9ACTN